MLRAMLFVLGLASSGIVGVWFLKLASEDDSEKHVAATGAILRGAFVVAWIFLIWRTVSVVKDSTNPYSWLSLAATWVLSWAFFKNVVWPFSVPLPSVRQNAQKTVRLGVVYAAYVFAIISAETLLKAAALFFNALPPIR